MRPTTNFSPLLGKSLLNLLDKDKKVKQNGYTEMIIPQGGHIKQTRGHPVFPQLCYNFYNFWNFKQLQPFLHAKRFETLRLW